jgi:hypothetical protein
VLVAIAILAVELLDSETLGLGLKPKVGLALALELEDAGDIARRLASESSDKSSGSSALAVGDIIDLDCVEDNGKVIDVAEPRFVPKLNKLMAPAPGQQLRL